MLKTISRSNFFKVVCNHYAFSSSKPKIEGGESDKIRKRTIADVIITLISKENDVSIVSLMEAQKLSKRKDLKLVKILDIDSKTQRPVYKLMTGPEYFVEDLKRREDKKESRNNDLSIKGEKLLPISSKIGQNDLQTRMKNVSKWLAKRYEVKVIISGSEDDAPKMEDLCAKITKEVGESAKILQKHFKGTQMKFQISPILQKQENTPTASLNEPQKREMHTQSGRKEL